MKSCLSVILCLWLVLLVGAIQLVQSLRGAGVPLRRAQATTCDLTSIPNGKVLRRQRGKMVQYVCNSPFRLIGSKYATCKNRRWDSPIPICAKAGCPDITTPAELQDHMIFYESDKLSVMLRCRSEYVLKGASVAYCLGKTWDRNLGQCHASSALDNLSCDFESDDLCGWSHDENDDYRWARRSGQPTALRLRTGPRVDHTVGRLHEGSYMVMESFEHEEFDRALLFSPIYSAEKSRDACFRFFYHMYGLMVGELRVYVRPVSVDNDMMVTNPKYRFFAKRGNQGNIWREAGFSLEELDESFQIVFEGTLRSSLFGDMAIDDVALMQGDECLPAGVTTPAGETATEAELEDNFAVILSCQNRCGERYNGSQAGPSCDCHDACLDQFTCCPDFWAQCLQAGDLTSTAATTTTTRRAPTTTKSTSTKSSKPQTTKSSSPRPSSTTTKTTRAPLTMQTQAKATTTSRTLIGTTLPATSDSVIQPGALDDQQYEEELFAMRVVSVHKTVIFVSIVAGLCVTLIVAMLLVRHCQRKRFDPEFYKRDANRNSGKRRSGSQSAREEFSEIRYLTEDEHLDFSLAAPSTFRSTPKAAVKEGEGDAILQGNEEEIDDGEEAAAVVGDELKDGDNSSCSLPKKKDHKLSSSSSSSSATSSSSNNKAKKSKKALKKTPKEDPDHQGLINDDEDDGGDYATLQDW